MKELSTKVFVIALIGTICFCLFIFIKQLIKEYKLRKSILNGYFVSADMFLKKWNDLYKNETWNKSGCYVILIYNHVVNDFHKEKYEAIYIGQSLHLASRVKQHLQGNGNKKVYYDYQNRKQIYIHLERCMPSYMNRMEKDEQTFERMKDNIVNTMKEKSEANIYVEEVDLDEDMDVEMELM